MYFAFDTNKSKVHQEINLLICCFLQPGKIEIEPQKHETQDQIFS
jgi:hypothetical protein